MKCVDKTTSQKQQTKDEILERRFDGTFYLYREFRELITDLLLAIEQQQMPFRIYETYRTPQRQRKLIALGLSTERNPLENAHVNGLAVDFLIDYKAVRSFEKNEFDKLVTSDLEDRADPISSQYGTVYNLGVNILGNTGLLPRSVVEDRVVLDFWNNLGLLIRRQYPQLVWGGAIERKEGQLIGVDPPHVEFRDAPQLIRTKRALTEMRAMGNPGMEDIK